MFTEKEMRHKNQTPPVKRELTLRRAGDESITSELIHSSSTIIY